MPTPFGLSKGAVPLLEDSKTLLQEHGEPCELLLLLVVVVLCFVCCCF